MKRKLPLFFGALFLVFAATACEGPAGPKGDPGETGETGATGPQGPAGTDGTNALNTCSDCHTSDATLVAIEQQFALSAHADNYLRTGSCDDCHTSQGFVAMVAGETVDFTGGAAKINCRTCHQVHTTYEGTDFALTTTDPVTLIVPGTAEIDVGNGNLCANCHQARAEDSYPQYDASVDSMFELGNHYDFHHGPQTNVHQAQFPTEVLYGMTAGTAFGSHSAATCTDCHMGIGDAVADFSLPTPTPGGTLGHNFAPDEDVCNSCHTNDLTDEDFDHNSVRTDVRAVLDVLQACLVAEGVLAVDGVTGEWHGVIDDDATAGTNEGLHPEPYVAAFLVYATLEEDGSMGAHNPSFVKGWLNATMTEMDTNSADAACDYTSPF